MEVDKFMFSRHNWRKRSWYMDGLLVKIFSTHVAGAASKANEILGLIRRSSVHLDIPLMTYLYTSMVWSHLEFENLIWQPLFKKDRDLLEKVQHRATTLVLTLSKLSYEERLCQTDLPSLSYHDCEAISLGLVSTYMAFTGLTAQSCFHWRWKVTE